jgi:tetratricopeptide (TPR) repeat protein
LTNDVADAGEKPSLAQLEELISTDPERATEELRRLLRGDPLNAGGYRLLARALRRTQETSAQDGLVRTTVRAADQLLMRAGEALETDDLETAEIILRRRLIEQPDDPDALYLIARLAHLLDYDHEAEELLRLAFEIVPTFSAARVALARLLDKRHRSLEAVAELEPVLAAEPHNMIAKALVAATLTHGGDFEESIKVYEEMLETWPNEAGLWSTYGHTLKTIGRSREGEAAMRRATRMAPYRGEMWWNLANIKTATFSDDEIATMLGALDRDDLGPEDRWNMHFALGKVFEDAGDATRAFAHYDKANATRLPFIKHNSQRLTAEVDASMRVFTPEFFEQRLGWGAPNRDPIFVIGMPRAGSTLVEQILASHPQIEGTKELPEIAIIAKALGRGHGRYYRNVSEMEPERMKALGEEYLQWAGRQRKSDRPFFIDKAPNNWLHAPLIHLLLPNAKIIDARRHPLACGFSNYKQNYGEGGAPFSYNLRAIGHYYHEYVRMMAHIDSVLPGRVHRVIHERLVDDTEAEIRSMLDYLELPFDPACLRFYETERAVRTPSAEQVRRPISRAGVEQWSKFEPWLGPLKEALGPVLDAYPGVPEEFTRQS